MNQLNQLKTFLARMTAVIALLLLTATTAWAETVEVKYIDENGAEKTAHATVLTGSETNYLDGGWYVCNTSAVENNGKGLYYTSKLTFDDDVHFILADGCKMTIESGENFGVCCSGEGSNLTVYGQREGTGSLVAKLEGAIRLGCVQVGGKLVINGGQFTLTGGDNGLSAINDLVINEGTIYAECSAGLESSNGNIVINGGTVETNSYNYGLFTDRGQVIINGGKVVAHAKLCGIDAQSDVVINGGIVDADADGYGILVKNGNIILGRTSTNDYIKSSGYYFSADNTNGVVKVADGRYFLVGGTTAIIGGTSGTDFSLDDIADKKLTPIDAIPSGGMLFIAFINNDANTKITQENVQVYIITGYDLAKGEVLLLAIEGNEIPKGLPVVIGHQTDGNSLPRFMAFTDQMTLSADDITAIKGDMLKNFVACDGIQTVQDYLDAIFGEGVSASEYIAYVLTGGLFKSVDVKASDMIKKDVCLLFIPKWDMLMKKNTGTTNSGVRSIGIGDGNATGILAVQTTPAPSLLRMGNAAQWFDLQGRKFQDEPTSKGIYIYKGKKVIIK